MKTVTLLRVSSKEQEDNYSLDAQKDRLDEYCKRKGLEKVREFRIVESSTRGERKDFNEMINWINAQKTKTALVVDTIDRIQRSFKESIMLDEMRSKEIIELHFLRENLVINENATPSEIMMWDFGVMGAKSYVLNLSSNVKRSNEKKLSAGEYTSAAPLGYLNYRDEYDKSQIKVDPERGYLIKKAFKLYASREYSIGTLTKWLNKEGFKSKKNNKLSSSTTHRILKNPFYYGQMEIKGKLYKHKYEPLIDEYLFSKCEEIRTGYIKQPQKYDSKAFIFKGLLTYEKTGRLMSGDIKKNKYVYYYSPKLNNSPSALINEKVVLKEVEKVFHKIKVPQKSLEGIRERLKCTHEAKKEFHNQQISSIQSKYKKNQSRLDILMDMRLEQSITKDEYDKKAYTLKQEQTDLEHQMKDLNKADDKFSITLNYLLDLSSRAYELFKSSKTEQKHKLVRFVFSNLSWDGEKVVYNLQSPFDVMVKCQSHSDWLPR